MRRRQRGDGFTLIELVVALAIATVIFSAMAAAGLAGVRASVVARQNQQAVDVLNKIRRGVPRVSFTTLAMVTSDLQVNDTAITGGSNPTYTVPNGIGQEIVWAEDHRLDQPARRDRTSGDRQRNRVHDQDLRDNAVRESRSTARGSHTRSGSPSVATWTRTARRESAPSRLS